MTWRVKVVAHPSRWNNAPTAALTKERAYDAEKVWHIVATSTDGLVVRSLGYVVQTRYGKTITSHQGWMVSGWHIGITAGDLARNYASKSGLDVVSVYGNPWRIK